MILEYITWNVNPEILSLGSLAIRWYGLLFALSFYLSYVIFTRFFKIEKVNIELLDKLTLYIAVGTIVGARLGHCFFYEPGYYLSNPIEIIKIWRGGLASHGAAIGIPVAIYLFSRTTKKKFLWVIDRIVIAVALAGCLIRVGNLMNSEIYGIETNSKSGFIYARTFTRYFDKDERIDKISFNKVENDSIVREKFIPLEMVIQFDKKLRDEERIKSILQQEINTRLPRNLNDNEYNIFYSPGEDFTYNITKDGRNYKATIHVLGVPKYPTHIYEALAYLLIFILLISIYYRNNGVLRPGMTFSIFLMTVFTARFFIEMIKENQVAFEETMKLNMGQILSIPLIITGIGLFIYSISKTKEV